MTAARPLSLAAGLVVDLAPADAVGLAADTGFDAVGLRFAAPGPDRRSLATTRARCRSAGLAVLDVEYARITADGRHDDWNRHLLEIAGELGAGHLLTISLDDDAGRTAAALASLGDDAAGTGVRVALEFMRFTSVPSLAAALAVVEATGRADVGVLVDALHLARAGETPADVAAADPGRLPYAQLCDAVARGPETLDGLGHEARHERLLPGDGELPLVALLQALPAGVALSVEVLSDRLMRHPAAERARLVRDATLRLLDAADDQASNSTG